MNRKLAKIHNFLNKHQYKKILSVHDNVPDVSFIVRCDCGHWAFYEKSKGNINNPQPFTKDMAAEWIMSLMLYIPANHLVEFRSFIKTKNIDWFDGGIGFTNIKYYKGKKNERVKKDTRLSKQA